MQRLEAALRESELRAGECEARNHLFQAQLQNANAEVQVVLKSCSSNGTSIISSIHKQ